MTMGPERDTPKLEREALLHGELKGADKIVSRNSTYQTSYQLI